jgi:uncharacterized protein (DUF2384 family)
VNDPFRKRGRRGPILSRDEGERQGRAVRAAQAALGNVEAVRDFLNSHHDSLDARPIDLAVASEAGLAAVEAAIAAEGRRRTPAKPQPAAKEARP